MRHQSHATFYVFSRWRTAPSICLSQRIRESGISIGAGQLEQRGERVRSSPGMRGHTPDEGPEIERRYRQ